MYMDDIKLFAKNEKELETLLQAVRIYSQDIGMEFGKEKCTMLIMRSKVKLVTLVKGEPKALFSIATTPRCREGHYSIPRIAPLYPWSLPYNAEC